eukprot:CAMPEP_0195519980 /NCGR_PEP_ID=MMETSP0794_2-20130614/15874_1 /TAXON_ID=515487 /ORGANISM="Stephanopyxis turris, Strain CCMP 815" /LENGTH=164 /DNA_ID=CAMNT_0040649241 /DNA_START=160 /DNA_END=654 /DNA_ORIENTATION=+
MAFVLQGHHIFNTKSFVPNHSRMSSFSQNYMVSEEASSGTERNPNMEAAWRYIKKPLLRIGGKGASASHGNSLRDLLNQHEAVKVKVNSRKMGSLEDVFEIVTKLAEEAGAPEGIELLRIRPSENTILFGMPGLSERIEKGEFPPPQAEPWLSKEEYLKKKALE